MDSIAISLLLSVLGASLALPAKWLFARMPESWLQDYDFNPKAKDFRLARRMQYVPHVVVMSMVCAVVFFLTSYLNPSYAASGKVFHYLLALAPILPLSMIVLSDALNRIIPDQLSLIAGVLCIFGFAADFLEGSLWFSASSPWYYLVLNRVLGGLIGALILFLIGYLGSMITGRESLGFGDVKLIAACGLLSGAYGLIFVVFLAFIAGGVFAFPLLIRKRRRIREEERVIIMSDDPEKTRRKLEADRDAMHYADDPDYIAFGPFLAIGTIAFLMLETPLHQVFKQMFLLYGM